MTAPEETTPRSAPFFPLFFPVTAMTTDKRPVLK